jgi:hypothetical protein
MYAAKQITSNDLSAVIPRIDWISGNTYTAYEDYLENFIFDSNGVQTNPFYARNSFDQIFKCLYSPGTGSTVEPRLSPGQTDPSKPLPVGVDGYKWIYVTTIDKGLKQKFFDLNWIPLGLGNNIPNTLASPAGYGSIDVINITNSGNNFVNDVSGTTTTITIEGDGTGASAYAIVAANQISQIIVTDAGYDYTFATVTVSAAAGYSGSGATANAVISPIGGHGYDPLSELGCNHIMLSGQFNGTEGGVLPANSTIRQVGVLVSPIENTGNVAANTIYNTSDIVSVSFGTTDYQIGEVIYQSTDGTFTNSYYTAIVSNFDAGNNVVSLINIVGTPAVGSVLVGQSSGASRIMLTYNQSILNVGSGYMMYYENRQPVARSINDNQQVRLLLKF